MIFAHYDPHAIVDDYVLQALACYRRHFELVHFVTASPLDAVQTSRVVTIVDRVIERRNVGYDFMSWRVGFEALPAGRRFDEVVFANDSCYGPCTDMDAFLGRVPGLRADLWGASINRQFRPHVQSFFMGFGRRLLQSGFARRFWQSVDLVPDKLALIFAYEIGLSTRVEAEGFRIGALVDFPVLDAALKARVIADNASDTDPQLAAAARSYIESEQALNPVQLCWGEALRRGLPFVKVELLRDNPGHANLRAVHDYLKRSTAYDVQLIARHLERTARAGAFPPLARTNQGMWRSTPGPNACDETPRA